MEVKSTQSEPSSSLEEDNAAVGRLDIGQCFSRAMEVYKDNFLILVVAGFLFEIISAFTLMILAGPLLGGVCVMTLEVMTRRDEKIDIGKMFSCFDRFMLFLAMFLLVAILTIIGLVVLIVPGLYLMTLWFYPFYFAADKKLPLYDALKASKDAVMRAGFFEHLGLLLVTVAMSVGVAFIPFVGVVAGWFVTPIVWLVCTAAYLQVAYPGNGRATPEQPAKCGRCGYLMRGVSTFTCPECGADLREVGMIPS